MWQYKRQWPAHFLVLSPLSLQCQKWQCEGDHHQKQGGSAGKRLACSTCCCAFITSVGANHRSLCSNKNKLCRAAFRASAATARTAALVTCSNEISPIRLYIKIPAQLARNYYSFAGSRLKELRTDYHELANSHILGGTKSMSLHVFCLFSLVSYSIIFYISHQTVIAPTLFFWKIQLILSWFICSFSPFLDRTAQDKSLSMQMIILIASCFHVVCCFQCF